MDVEEAVSAAERGEVALHQLDELLGDSSAATRARRLFIERRLGLSLEELDSGLPFNEIVGRNCENTIGSVALPLGIAGPLRVLGGYFRGEAYVPIATTEGALVASVNRGCSVLSESGGARVAVLSDAMSRAPVIVTPSLAHSLELAEWVRSNLDRIREAFNSTTRHGELLGAQPFITGRRVYLRLTARTGDAMGMNMVTRGAEEVARLIEREMPWARYVALSSNLCSDKKQTAVNWVLGRGKSVSAEVVIPRRLVEERLKTTPREMEQAAFSKYFIGSARAGTMGGYNAHAANILAGIFIATGQDPAQVVESSMGITYVEETEEGGLYASVTLPSLEVGTVGGGTWLPAQRKALEIMGVAGPGSSPGLNALKMAEITTAAVLAGEVSLLAAIAAHHLATSHIRLGRGGLRRGDRRAPPA